jgi:hypothetical protein
MFSLSLFVWLSLCVRCISGQVFIGWLILPSSLDPTLLENFTQLEKMTIGGQNATTVQQAKKLLKNQNIDQLTA